MVKQLETYKCELYGNLVKVMEV
ncbi:hypothetical protein DO021_04390 [Desulfobacter hydrogenophilus]|uniref:Uncharacterized protein n=1 Tax=Desulfobacter hydrogenophilus TaxID=2291 RepID=A0A328FJX3_9BACT|nr:hypothetical protein [Desulfobacter hydrogenophilus]QBH15478.1 hypothetical protein EYB58_00655 [Desulfobacter hydrogenophilus]RAM03215.1 hypothetical protein DO021_04390 [Desulfobacter hydrogenophilus]